MKTTNWKKYLVKGSLFLGFLAFVTLNSCNKRSFDSSLAKALISGSGKDTVITLDTIINRLDTTVIDTNFHDLLTFDVEYDSKNLPTDTLLSVDNGSHELDFIVNSDGEDWQYFKAVDVDWITEITKTDGELKLSVAENKGAARSAYILFSLNKYPAKYKLVTLTQEAAAAPVADLLDVVFNSDGTAKDISSMNMTVTKVDGTNAFTTTHNSTYDLDVVNFNPATPGILQPFGDAAYYRIDYGSNTDFQSKVADGFSMEALAKVDYDFVSNPVGSEVKIFGSIYGGGYSLMLRTSGGGENSWAFQVNLNNTYYYLNAGVIPQQGEWYHLVGVWNEDTKEASLYLDGVRVATEHILLKSFQAISNANMKWIAIGGNGGIGNSGTDLNNSFKGSIGLVRMYDKPLTADEVKALWRKVDK